MPGVLVMARISSDLHVGEQRFAEARNFFIRFFAEP
jgi:hypothetical protein